MSKEDRSIKLKWVCLYLAKGRSRYLEIFKLYFDGSLDKFPVGSICLDDPIVLLDPRHPKLNKARPSDIAKSCDLCTDENCYRLLRLVEEQIASSRNFWPSRPIAYVATELDAQLRPAKVLALEYSEAMTLFSDHAENLRLPVARKAHDPKGPLHQKFAAHAADLRVKSVVPPARRRPGAQSSFF